jgi:hypothetical protein
MQAVLVWYPAPPLRLARGMQIGAPVLAPEERSISAFFLSLAERMLERAHARGDFGRGEIARNP